jgi:pimeloyl-ACP methyl ester carboxylesterase
MTHPEALPMPHWQIHEGTGPFLLLVHGFLSSRSQWQANLDALGQVCRPVTMELFGHARSPSPADPACYDPDYYVACFEEIRRTLGAQQWFVLGYSLGAGLTIRYVLQHPGRIFGHLFTNSTSGFADDDQVANWQASAAQAAASIRNGGAQAMARIPVHPRHARRLPEDIRAALIEDAVLHNPAGIANTLAITNPRASIRHKVIDNPRPACLLFGNREKRFHPHKEFALANMPDLSIVEIDAGHGMNMEAPAAFNLAVSAFIRKCLTA